jgi:hypothetical protein
MHKCFPAVNHFEGWIVVTSSWRASDRHPVRAIHVLIKDVIEIIGMIANFQN